MGNEITIKNGKTIKEWAVIALAVLTLSVGGILGFGDLRGQVKENAEDNETLCIKVEEVEEDTSQNHDDIIAIKKDVEYTAKTIEKIALKLNIIP